MSEIVYMEKPDWVSWEDIQACIHSAHQTNKRWGFEMLNSNKTAEELANQLDDGKCFVAIEDNKVIGTASVKLLKINKWWARGTVLYYCYDAILPKYRGTDVFFGIINERLKFVRKTGIRIHQFATAEHNKTIIKINQKDGFKLVQLSPTGKGANYYSVIMVKWSDGCPYPDWLVNFMFKLSKVVVKTLWKPGYKLRLFSTNDK